MVKTTIDDLTLAGDCGGLQEQFDIAAENSTATLNRTGHTNADLMQYIDAAMRGVGCY